VIIPVCHLKCFIEPFSFPRFFPEPKRDRFTSLDEPASQPGAFARLPLDILILILPHLSTTSFVALSATCRLLRLYAMTVFQPHARALVLSLGWATPLLGLGEYQTAISQNPKNALHLVHPIKSARTGDWFLYLSHVHRTSSMRARRRIWTICEAVLRAVEKKLPASKYGKRLDVERAKIETRITYMHQAMFGMRELIELSKAGASLVPIQGWTGGHVHIPTNNQ
jgi:F-box-like